ncbi:hypothetical protein LOK49_LG03G02579 [Camellia lanceoleosa]|uniref:Uncharacterized protein n=1 Tax=Camellia lanceoleosa TaxID=1840588 RepID=A0ACC0I6C1_9ERIC|nr:hypothetical protein LOK49_LG03G02579 [Camellia lanceoleosa]
MFSVGRPASQDKAALEAPRILNLNNNKYFSGPYGEDVVFIANDWHIALLPCYLKTKYKPMGIYKNARVVFCIHNIAYQGRFPFADFSLLNLPEQFKGSFDFIDGYDKPTKGSKINWMKGGILELDRVVTMSPYYAQELVSGIDKGVELDNIIKKTGIMNLGKKYMEKRLEQLEIIYPDKARGVAKFNVPLAHMIIVGSDFMLLPSRFEPCGLIQLHAMRYGSLTMTEIDS